MKVFLLVLLIATPAWAAPVVVYDEQTGRVKSYDASAHTPDFENRTDSIVNPDLSSVTGVHQKYWTVKDSKVVMMNNTQKAQVDAELTSDHKSSLAARIDSGNISSEELLRALGELDPNLTEDRIKQRVKERYGL